MSLQGLLGKLVSTSYASTWYSVLWTRVTVETRNTSDLIGVVVLRLG